MELQAWKHAIPLYWKLGIFIWSKKIDRLFCVLSSFICVGIDLGSQLLVFFSLSKKDS